MTQAEIGNPVHVSFGPGTLGRLPELVEGPGILVTTRGTTRRGLTGRVVDLLGPERVTVHDDVTPNPTLAGIKAAAAALRDSGAAWLIGLGGGSALDTAKVLGVALATDGFDLDAWITDPHRYDDVQPLPVVAVPTTAGTGAEVTPFATLWHGPAKRKLSVTTPRMHPRDALVDPELALSLDWEATLGPGLDAYAQCLEAIWNRNATAATTTIARRGLGLAPDALRRLREDGTDLAARTDIAEAALSSGLAISVTRTGLAHSMSYPVTAHFGVAHGLACALSLPAVLAFNEADADARAAVPADLPDAAAVRALLEELGLPALIRERVPAAAAYLAMAPQMLTPERAGNNLRPAGEDDIRGLLAETAGWIWPGTDS